jgi:Ca-activated chloride channel family protein
MRLPSFADPAFLALVPLALVMAWWWARRRRTAVRYSDTTLFAGSGGRARRAVWGGAALRGLACLALVLACAGPRLPDERTRLPAEAVAVMMVVDVSGTMAEPVPWVAGQPPVTRLEVARRAFKLFVAGGEAPDGTRFEARPSDQIGLVAFASVPQTVCPLTLNHTVLLAVADGLAPKGAKEGGTKVGNAIAEALVRLEAVKGPGAKVMILLSDGQEEGTPLAQPREAAQLAANLNYRIYTIDAGPDPAPGAPPTDERRQGRETLRDVAEMTGGRAFVAGDGSSMLAAFKEIDSAERARVETFQYRRYFEYHWWCAAAAVVFLLTAHMLDRTRWRTVP